MERVRVERAIARLEAMLASEDMFIGVAAEAEIQEIIDLLEGVTEHAAS